MLREMAIHVGELRLSKGEKIIRDRAQRRSNNLGKNLIIYHRGGTIKYCTW